MANRTEREIGGYEAEFVSTLPNEYECPICQLAYRDPVQLEECGHRLCYSCLQELRRRQGECCVCPLDRRPVSATKMFFDKAAKRAILSQTVKCCNWKRKCDWSGELSSLEDHLKNCNFEEIQCTNAGCDEMLTRRSLQYHLSAKCKLRIVSCSFCTETYCYKDNKVHMKRCKRLPLECFNKCGKKDIAREEMSVHLNTCPMATHPCSYVDVGCDYKGKRDNLEEHYKSSVQKHLELACCKIRENESRTVCIDGKFIWKINNYRKQMDESLASDEETAIFSPVFYTSQYGYKLKLKAYLDGRDRGRGTHLSLYIIIMKGDYDALLDWPYNMKVTFYLLDQSERRQHRSHTLSPNLSLPNIKVVFNRPIGKENLGIGNPCFVPHELLDSGGFVQDDTIFIKVALSSSTNLD
ncbi:TNF receptor-associated factor 4-like [Paramuricea clavata]|uniref:TNF receptor-associated factor 4-like n=1 Tax=Paramuricea clavata TaxID=317549 RepID=A0A6S7HQ63_PARCT|nr:TNF receptor-associated factor 4-like [Paramuricea clavata]